MKRRLTVGLSTFALALGASAPAHAAPIEIGHIPECTELVPAAVSIDSTPVQLDVRILLDGVSQARGSEVAQTMRGSYAPLGINLAPSFEAVAFGGTEAQGLIDQAKARFGGQRPLGTDLVYVLTSKNIQVEGLGDAVAGLADCIGGVAFPDRAFAVGENFADDGIDLGVAVNGNLSAKVGAHELGHLMGGHHHYANCAEGILSEPSELSPCSLMFNDVGLASLNFGTANGLVVKGHGQAYAAP